MAEDKRQTAMHEAGHAALIHLIGKAQIYWMMVEREFPLPNWEGEVKARWNEQPTVEEKIRLAYAGPCAEMKYLANADPAEHWDFDLTDDARSFIHPETTADGLVRLRFRRADGQTKELEHEHGPFGTDREMAASTEANDDVLLAQLRAVRELLNVPVNWNGVLSIGNQIADQGHFVVHRTSFFADACKPVIAHAFPPAAPPPTVP
ncbi:MAG: hypothetical protein FJ271_29985 [Planctomycetes bacterium]|nr:hypothetical protein [Planctomycetota bacterium]